MNAKREKAENETVAEAIRKLDGQPIEDDSIGAIRSKLARAAELSPSSPVRMGKKFLRETDPGKN